MPKKRPQLVVLCLFLAAVAACTAPAGQNRAQPGSESGCYVAPDPVKCKFASALAGGPPMQVTGTDR